MRVQRSAQRNIHYLRPTADAQQRFAVIDRRTHQTDLGCIPRIVHTINSRVG